MAPINKLCTLVSSSSDSRIILLRNKEVIMWLFGNLSFLPHIDKRKNKTFNESRSKTFEDAWGQNVLKRRRPDLKLSGQWTNKFGEYLCEEVLILQGKNVFKPENKEHYQPDVEVDDAIWEAKTGTFHTKGTVYEKILGCPFKYADIPKLYSKPLKILCIGGAERVCRKEYGNLTGKKCSFQKRKFLTFFKNNQIEYVGITDILKKLVN